MTKHRKIDLNSKFGHQRLNQLSLPPNRLIIIKLILVNYRGLYILDIRLTILMKHRGT